jgi:hypothetical protein
MATGGKGDFTPGAGLSPAQIKRVLAFATCKGRTNAETIANMKALLELPPLTAGETSGEWRDGTWIPGAS